MVNKEYTFHVPLVGKSPVKVKVFRLCFRSLYVGTTTGVGMLFPYFNQVLGVVGALIFWPLAVYFPVEMYIAQRKVRALTPLWVALEAFSAACLVVSAVTFVGSLEGIIREKFM